jgi:hypothetical protein
MKFRALVAATAMVGSFVCGSASAATLVFQVTVDTREAYQFEIKNNAVKTDKTTTTHPSQTFNLTLETDDLFALSNSSYSDATSAAWRTEGNPSVLSATALPSEAELLTLAGGAALGAAESSTYFKAADDYYVPYGTSDVLVHRTDNAALTWGRYRDAYQETATTTSNNFGGYYFSMSYDSLASLPAYDPRTFTSAQLLELFEGKAFTFATVGYAGSFLDTNGYTNSQKYSSITYSGVARLLSVETPLAAVPEPSTWALMIGGFGAAGAMVRRRRKALAA